MTRVNFLKWLESIFLDDSSQFSTMTRVNFLKWLASIFLNELSVFLNDPSQFSSMTPVNFLEWLESIFLNDSSQFSRMTRVNFLEWLESIFGNNWSQSFPTPPPIHPRPALLTPVSHPNSSLSIYWLELGRSAQTERKGTAHSKLSDPPHHPYLLAHPKFDCLWIRAIYRYWGKNRSIRLTSIVSHTVLRCR